MRYVGLLSNGICDNQFKTDGKIVKSALTNFCFRNSILIFLFLAASLVNKIEQQQQTMKETEANRAFEKKKKY